VVARLAAALVREGMAPADVGIVTPYAAQAALVSGLLSRDGALAGVEVSSVDGFQGREKEAILLSCVRCNSRRHVGFLGDARRLNVAITRPRSALILVGHCHTLEAHPTWRPYLAFLREASCVVSSVDDLC
jgi:superfamily I DNA and/or RNA helicase